jgi:hypothetical protein
MVKIDLKARGIIANFILQDYFIAVTGYADCFGILEPKANNFLLFVTPTNKQLRKFQIVEDFQEKYLTTKLSGGGRSFPPSAAAFCSPIIHLNIPGI